ncbi:MAG: helix-turn-helix domain-containing protein [Bacteroides sp.]|nr:helix-turn-helix domain-containing protein [Eubacterium sp.]MCM1418480.1 helix-turn-helix domain-containing protein [Roseburia sp.]MCM1462499.1 helix-turn-helix domain-containing protein [Bacteroides sp.]
MTFGERLRGLLEDRDITQKEFAAMLKIAPTTLNGYINDKREPDFTLLKEIALVLGVSTDFLLDCDRGEAAPSGKELSLLMGLRRLPKQQREIVHTLVRVSVKALVDERE